VGGGGWRRHRSLRRDAGTIRRVVPHSLCRAVLAIGGPAAARGRGFGLLRSGALGPLYWLAHNWWLYGDPLEFYETVLGVGHPRQPAVSGKGDWPMAWLYFRTAAQLCAGPGLALMAIAGAAASLARRVFWPLALLALPGVFYIWSIYSSPPHLRAHALAQLVLQRPLWAGGAAPAGRGFGGLVAIMPHRMRAITAALVIAAGTVYWMVNPQPRNWICWEESRVNSEARRAWIHEAPTTWRPATCAVPVSSHRSGI